MKVKYQHLVEYYDGFASGTISIENENYLFFLLAKDVKNDKYCYGAINIFQDIFLNLNLVNYEEYARLILPLISDAKITYLTYELPEVDNDVELIEMTKSQKDRVVELVDGFTHNFNAYPDEEVGFSENAYSDAAKEFWFNK